MKKIILITLSVFGLFMYLWLLKQKQPASTEVAADTRVVEQTPEYSPQNPHTQPSTPPDILEDNETWVKNRSGGLTLPPIPDPTSADYRGEDVILYRYQLLSSGLPILLGEWRERRVYSLHVKCPSAKSYPLSVTYPLWGTDGIQTSGGFVFMKNENPVNKIGVIIPKVKTPEDMGLGAADLLEWQILIRVNDGSYVDARTSAKPQTLDSDVVVLMPTNPDKIPTNSFVTWFKFEKDGTVSLLED